MNKKIIVFLAVFFAAVIAGSAAGVVKKGLQEVPPYSFVFLRCVISSLLVLPFFLRLKKDKIAHIRDVSKISFLGAINVAFFSLGLQLTTANAGVIIYAAVPLLIAIILFVFFKERLSREKEWGLILGFIGVFFIAFLPVLESGNAFSGNLLGNTFLMIAVVAWSFYMVYSKRLHEKYSVFLITCNFIFISTLVLFPFFLWEILSHYGWWENLSWQGISAILYMGVMIGVVGYALTQFTIKHGGAVFSSMMFYIKPIFGFGINFLLLGELLTPGFILGSLLALLGTYLVVRK